MFRKTLVLLASTISAMLMNTYTTAYAQIVTGQAYIENGNAVKAKESARREAMRTFVESQVGVKINSESEMENFLLVRDHIVSKSEGYVLVKRVVSEKNDGAIFYVTLDLEAGSKPIELALADIKTQLQSLDRNSSRGSLDIAVTDENPNSTYDCSTYMVAALKREGFSRIKKNDHILAFLGTGNNNQMNKLLLYPELRRVGKLEATGAKAIVRGTVRLAEPAKMTGASYMATAQAAIEIIGYDSDNVDALFRYATAVGNTATEAIAQAKQQAMAEVARGLAEQASVTVQYEEQGGKREIETTIIFADIYNKVNDSEIILSALESVNCEIDRNVFAGDNTFHVAIYTQEYNKLNDVINALVKALRSNYPNAVTTVAGDIGATKTVIRLGAR